MSSQLVSAGSAGPIEHLLFDLDDTLYRNPTVAKLMKDNITGYMRQQLHVTEDYIAEHAQAFYMDYGTTLAGLAGNGYTIDYEDWHKHVHGCLPYSKLLQKDAELRRVLESLPQPKHIFTNADIKHAETVLGILGIRDLFEGIICFESIMHEAKVLGIRHSERPVICKPHQEAFELALAQAGCKPETTVFLDDSRRNVEAAMSLGIRSVLVGAADGDSIAVAGAQTLHDLPHAAPWLWPDAESTQESTKEPLQQANAEVKVSAE